MGTVDFDWVRSQFEKAHVRQGSGDAVLSLLKTWEEFDLDESLATEATEIFGQLALGHALIPENANETWVDVIPGSIRVGQEVRVKSDAFNTEAGRVHNGRRGKVVAIRFGDVIFRSTDNQNPLLDGVHYSPYKLQMRVR